MSKVLVSKMALPLPDVALHTSDTNFCIQLIILPCRPSLSKQCCTGEQELAYNWHSLMTFDDERIAELPLQILSQLIKEFSPASKFRQYMV